MRNASVAASVANQQLAWRKRYQQQLSQPAAAHAENINQ
jgi:hypothetical protein